ncbi:glutaredoxin domain-containing protein [Arcanobacterium hippocoleae]|uniref:Glutaredoxin-like protein n=1 Tax=Arcanobacterium hippocoleae TaxID=149017 RepID=A0ABU1SZW0_9ACTO|nr:glutaredoxin domain-containing protein [Arcanobacterium hippocoleae]MDR6938584.1 glutaredoxin-like protein [Arcanobacterium hippocoleae]
MAEKIQVYGADWCGDCRLAKKVLGQLAAEYEWYDVAASEELKDKAIEISGQMRIPVVVYPDGTFQVEPSATDLKQKVAQL